MPPLPPVISATFPSSLPIASFLALDIYMIHIIYNQEG
jgi:hypothetical protein